MLQRRARTLSGTWVGAISVMCQPRIWLHPDHILRSYVKVNLKIVNWFDRRNCKAECFASWCWRSNSNSRTGQHHCKGAVFHFHGWPVFSWDQHTKADTAVVAAATSQSPSPAWRYLKSHPCSTGVEGMKVLRLRGSWRAAEGRHSVIGLKSLQRDPERGEGED